MGVGTCDIDVTSFRDYQCGYHPLPSDDILDFVDEHVFDPGITDPAEDSIQQLSEFSMPMYSLDSRLMQRGAPQDFIDFIGNDLDEITRPVFEYEFPVLEISDDLDMPGIYRVFETLNSTEKNLNSFNICVAKFYEDNLNIRTEIEDAMEKKADDKLTLIYPYLHILFNEEKYHIYPLQVIALVSGRKHTQNSLSIQRDAQMIRNLWEKTMYAINETLKMMDGFGACTSTTLSLIPYAPTIVIIATALINCNYQNMSTDAKGAAKKRAKRYFFQTALTLKYGDAAMPQTIEDSKTLSQWFTDESNEPEFMKTDATWYLQDMLRINGYKDNGARVKMVRCLMNIQNPKDFKTEDEVMSYGTKGDLHHIFPEARYPNSSVKGYSIDSVFNLTYISSNTNKSIGKERTFDYIDALINSSYEGHEDGFKKVVACHFIRDNVTYEAFKGERHDDFLESRDKEMMNYLESFNINVKLFDSADEDSEDSIRIIDDN